MFGSPAAEPVDPSTASQTIIPFSEKRRRWFELCLVLLVSYGSPILNSLYLLVSGPVAMPHISSLRWSIGIVQEMAALLLLGYVLSRRGHGFKSLGLRWSFRDAGIGVLVFGLSVFAYVVGASIVQVVHFWAYSTVVHGHTAQDFFASPSLVFIPFSLLNPFFEELIARAYLMTEVVELTRSRSLAVILSVGLQFSYHLYYGWIGATSLAFVFLAFALYYVYARRALPVIVAHAFFDIIAFLRLFLS